MATIRHRDVKSESSQTAQPSMLSNGAIAAAASAALKSAPAGSSATLLVHEESKKKWQSAWVRTYTTLIMLGGFILLVYLGHIPLMFLLIACQTAMFKEVKRLSKVLSTQQDLPSFRPLHWYWFLTAMFFSYGRVLASEFHTPIPYHSFISFALYMLGVVVFVLSLQGGYYKYQFEMFAWVHLTLLLIVVQSTFIVVNMFSGLVWFILPALLIVSNDTWAYIFGFFFGRTPLIQLSPKKTWEGFIGAFFSTVVTGFFLARFLAQFEFMACPKEELNFDHPTCEIATPYVPVPVAVPEGIASWLEIMVGGDWSFVTVSPVQYHAVVLALFASIIAPFGGFFASGFKRAFNIKDFGASIPGHGGVTDRMDCQIMMGLFTFVYVQTFVLTSGGQAENMAGDLMKIATWQPEQQVEFYTRLQQMLMAKGLLQA